MNKIFVIYTGGTIGMVRDNDTDVFIPFSFELIKQHVPELLRLNYDLTVHSFDPIIDSSNMHPETWLEMAHLIEQNYHKYDGFVILHGSDTMSYSASALSFMLEGLQKPVIFSGSQLPIGEIRTDARENLLTALELATTKIDDIPLIQEVCIFFDNKLYRGNRSFKYNAAKFEAFRSPNYPVLAESGVHLNFSKELLLNNLGQEFKLHKKLDNSVAVIKLFPGISPAFIKSVLLSDVRSVILETFGVGNCSTEKWFLKSIGDAIKQGKNILNITQCMVGSVELGRYETSQHLSELGVLSGFDMTFEAAITKLMFLQGQYESQEQVAFWIGKNMRGELTDFHDKPRSRPIY